MKWANIRNYISWKTKKNYETWNKIRIDLIQYTTLKKQFEVLKNFAELQQLQKIEYFLKSSTNESKMFVSPKKFCSKHIPYFLFYLLTPGMFFISCNSFLAEISNFRCTRTTIAEFQDTLFSFVRRNIIPCVDVGQI